MATVMLDTVGANVGAIPASTRKVAGYVTGTGVVPWSQSAWNRFPHAVKVRIDQSPGGRAALSSDVIDVEWGAATPVSATSWIKTRRDHGVRTHTIYGTRSTLAACAGLIRDKTGISCWVADWNQNESSATALLGTTISGFPVVAVQWASPSSNPRTQTPGGNTPLSVSNCDISITVDGWPSASPAVTPPPPPKHTPVPPPQRQPAPAPAPVPYTPPPVPSRNIPAPSVTPRIAALAPPQPQPSSSPSTGFVNYSAPPAQPPSQAPSLLQNKAVLAELGILGLFVFFWIKGKKLCTWTRSG